METGTSKSKHRDIYIGIPKPGAVQEALHGSAPREVTFVVPGPPKGKGRPRFSRKSGTAFTPTETRNYEAAVRMAAAAAMHGRPPMEGALRVEVLAKFPIPTSWSGKKRAAAVGAWYVGTPDADNLAKVLDGANEIVFHDDKQIAQICVQKVYDAEACLIVTVRAL